MMRRSTLLSGHIIQRHQNLNRMENMLWQVENMEQLNARREHMLLPPIETTGIKIYEQDRDIRFLH